jgi:hypothetical protein
MNTKEIIIIILVILVTCGIIIFQFFSNTSIIVHQNSENVHQNSESSGSLSNTSTSQNTGNNETSITGTQSQNISNIQGQKDIDLSGNSGNIDVSGLGKSVKNTLIASKNPLEKHTTDYFNNKQISLVYDYKNNNCLYHYNYKFTTLGGGSGCRSSSFFHFLAYKKNSNDSGLVLSSIDKNYFFNVLDNKVSFDKSHDNKTFWKFYQDAADSSSYYIRLDGSSKYLNYVTLGKNVSDNVQVLHEQPQKFKLL